MNLELKIKLKLILGGVVITVILAALSPFIFSGEIAQGVFLASDFLVVVYLWKNFNSLRITINKKELEDEKLSKLEEIINHITKSKK